MSSTIYGGKTVNGVFVEDMVDDSKDYVYYLDEQQTYFVRLSGAKVEESKEIKPAFVLFNSSRPFDVLYGKILDKEYLQYVDKFGRDYEALSFWIGQSEGHDPYDFALVSDEETEELVYDPNEEELER